MTRLIAAVRARLAETERDDSGFTIEQDGEGRDDFAEVPPPVLAAKAAGGIRAMQEKVRHAAKSYLSRGNAALKEDWSEF